VEKAAPQPAGAAQPRDGPLAQGEADLEHPIDTCGIISGARLTRPEPGLSLLCDGRVSDSRTTSRCAKTFVRLDVDGDSKIGLSDLQATCARLSYIPAKGELETMIWEVDETLDSAVSWDEFSLCYRRVRSDTTGLEPRALYNLIDFLMLDSSAAGVVSKDEARQLMFMRHGKGMDETQVDKLFESAGGGSTITLPQFLRYTAEERDQIAKTVVGGGGSLLTKMKAVQKEKIRSLKSTSSMGKSQ
jgi:calmodulin